MVDAETKGGHQPAEEELPQETVIKSALFLLNYLEFKLQARELNAQMGLFGGSREVIKVSQFAPTDDRVWQVKTDFTPPAKTHELSTLDEGVQTMARIRLYFGDRSSHTPSAAHITFEQQADGRVVKYHLNSKAAINCTANLINSLCEV